MVAGTRPLDLYDFFSVFVPGAAFIVGLVPFLPDGSDVTALGAVVPIVVGGYVVGRGFHSLAAWLDGVVGEAHRTRFFSQVAATEPEDFADDVRNQFLTRCNRRFGIPASPVVRNPAAANRNTLRSLYSTVRSHAHIDGRGRSRTFQAVYAFHRSMWVIVVVLGILYLGYAFVRIQRGTEGIVAYRSILRSIGLDPLVLFLLVAITLSLSFATFRRSKATYRKHFVEYLVADFLTIETESEEVSSDDGEQGRSGTERHDRCHGAIKNGNI